MLATVRYAFAFLLWVSLPPALLYWVLIHPLAATWRRLGPWVTYAVITIPALLLGWALYSVHEPALQVRYPFSWLLLPPAILLYGVATRLEILCRRHLKLGILVGLPEVRAGDPGRLLTQGIYGRSRNPRYVAILFGLAAWALFINYLAIYLMALAAVPAVWLVVLLEERELEGRFGEEYRRYRERVPRFLSRDLLGGDA